MFTIANADSLNERLISNVINADVFINTDENSSIAEHQRMDDLNSTLLAITDTFKAAKNLSNVYVVTGHIEGDSPITKAVMANSHGESKLAFTLIVLEDMFGPNGRDSAEEEPEVHIDCAYLLSSLIASNDEGSNKQV